MYPDLQDMLSHWGQCALCSQPFLTTWLECVQFINTKKVQYQFILHITPYQNSNVQHSLPVAINAKKVVLL